MSLPNSGTSTLHCEVTEIHKTGFWIFLNGSEYFLPFQQFPMFVDKKVEDIFNVQYFKPAHLYWENIDIDLELDSIKNPGDYPLIYRET
jgi:hypothetical protein